MDKFWSKVAKTDSCWMWTGARSSGGYGVFWHEKKPVGAHRVSYELAHGEVPHGLHVLHSCRERRCVNPSHLRAGTREDNMLDLRRDRAARGLKVDADKAIALNKAGMLQKDIGALFGATQGAVSQALRKRGVGTCSRIGRKRGKVDYAAAAEMLKAGHTQTSIAEHFKVGPGVVSGGLLRRKWAAAMGQTRKLESDLL